jgi:hypothetical protein
MEKKDDAVAQFMALIKDFPKIRESELATQQVQQLAPELLAPPVAPAPLPPAGRKPRKP